MDVGFNVPRPNPQQGGQLQVWFKVSDRMVMSYPTAGELANSLIQNHEEAIRAADWGRFGGKKIPASYQ